MFRRPALLFPLLFALGLLLSGCIGPQADPNATAGPSRPADFWFEGEQGDEATGGDGSEPEPSPSASGSPSASPTPTNTTSPSPAPTNTSTSSPSPTPEGETYTVEIGKNVQGQLADYSPNSITVKVGDSVIWENLDSLAHTATANGGHFSTGNIPGGSSSGPEPFNKPGTFTYFCAYHSGMTGAKVIVEA